MNNKSIWLYILAVLIAIAWVLFFVLLWKQLNSNSNLLFLPMLGAALVKGTIQVIRGYRTAKENHHVS